MMLEYEALTCLSDVVSDFELFSRVVTREERYGLLGSTNNLSEVSEDLLQLSLGQRGE